MNNSPILSGEDEYTIRSIADNFLQEGDNGSPPRFAIVTGDIGLGKTNFRWHVFQKGFVYLDYGEVYNLYSNMYLTDNPRWLINAELTCEMILKEGIRQQKNMVIEIIGDKQEEIDSIKTYMTSIGYEVEVYPISEKYKKINNQKHFDNTQSFWGHDSATENEMTIFNTFRRVFYDLQQKEMTTSRNFADGLKKERNALDIEKE